MSDIVSILGFRILIFSWLFIFIFNINEELQFFCTSYTHKDYQNDIKIAREKPTDEKTQDFLDFYGKSCRVVSCFSQEL